MMKYYREVATMHSIIVKLRCYFAISSLNENVSNSHILKK
jgi:hypothetical protein